MSDDKPLVNNAANTAQINEASKREKRGRELELQDMKNVLATAHGRRLLWRMLSHCRTFESVLMPLELIQANAGRQDVGHFILAEVMDADEGAFLLMSKESKGSK